MVPFAIAGIQTYISAVQSNLDRIRIRLNTLMAVYPWVQMVVFSELATYGPLPKHAETLPGPSEKAFQEMAAQHGIWLLPGSMFEKRGDRIYNTASVIDPSGRVVGRYRKMFPFLPYEMGVSAGDEFLVFEVPEVGKFGVSICYDMWFPETTRTMTVMGAEVILHPSLTGTIDRDAELSIVRATAVMNQCYVFDINGLGDGGVGRSIICGPEGMVWHQAGYNEEMIPIEIDLERVRYCRKQGMLRLGQTLKSFRDRQVAFPIYETGATHPYLDSLGPLEKPVRKSISARAPAPSET